MEACSFQHNTKSETNTIMLQVDSFLCKTHAFYGWILKYMYKGILSTS